MLYSIQAVNIESNKHRSNIGQRKDTVGGVAFPFSDQGPIVQTRKDIIIP